MGRFPNHRFSVEKKREITALESKLDSIKRRIKRPFLETRKAQVALKRASSTQEQSQNMGKNDKRRGGDYNWDERDSGGNNENGPTTHNNSNGFHGESGNGNGRGNATNTRNNGGDSEDWEGPEVQMDLDFGPYAGAVDELNKQMVASQKVMKKVNLLYTRHYREIQEVIQTRQKLRDITKQCKVYETTIEGIQNVEREKREKLAEKMAEIARERKELNIAKEKAKGHEKMMEEEKENFEKRVRETEAEQKIKLDEQRIRLEKEQDELYRERVEMLEKETKERQDGDAKRIADLEAENNKLLQSLDEEKRKSREAEHNCKDQEKLKRLYEGDVEKLRNELKSVENEFGLNSGTTEYYEKQFRKIYNDIQDISSRNFKELHVNDLQVIHDKLKESDDSFANVPISTTEVSEKLRVAHAQRVISSRLRDIIWQPFSSEITLQDLKYVTLLSQISEGLVKSTHGSSGGRRAARMCTALAMRGLQSQAPIGLSPSTSDSTSPSPRSRAQVFTDEVMRVLSVLVKPSLHPNLRNNLLDLANSAIDVWNTAQIDEREFVAHPTLDPSSIDEWRAPMFHKITTDEDMSTTQGVFVLFPRITARNCSRVVDVSPTNLPGMWIDSEPQQQVPDICIHRGWGLAEWSSLVLDGEEEEEERKKREKLKEVEKKKRAMEKQQKEMDEEMRNLEKTATGSKRRISQGRRESTTGSGSSPSSPTAEWMSKGGQKIPEGDD